MNMKHIHRALLAAAVCVVLSVGCGDDGPCASGSVGTIIVGKDAFVIEGFDQGFLAGGYSEDQVFPYADGSPFLTCRSVGSLVVREVIDGIDGDRDFPELETLGSIFVDFDDEGGDQAVPRIDGFNRVTTLGSISGVHFTSDLASIGEIAGFNSVESVASLRTHARITGFNALHEVTGNLGVGTLDGLLGIERVGGEFSLGFGLVGALELASLEEVGGDLIADRTRLTSVAFPALARVGGSLEIVSNPLERWDGAALGARIAGDFLARANAPMRNEDFADKIVSLQLRIEGDIKICQNGDPREPGETCNDQ